MPYEEKNKPFLSGKNILLISPQRWEGFKVSKHHYALELTKRGNRVFFLPPPNKKISRKIRIQSIENRDNLFQVDYHVLLPYRFKFHLPTLYQEGMNRQAKRIAEKIGGIDIIWDFDNTLMFHSYKGFQAKQAIFHPVDKGPKAPLSKHPDIVFSVSPVLLEEQSHIKVPHHFIDHGISGLFLDLAKQQAEQPDLLNYRAETPVKVAYVGNLKHPAIDREILMKLVEGQPEVEFHFFGPYEGINVQKEPALNSFIQFLKDSQNVHLHGLSPQKKIIKHSPDFDVFLACYKKTATYNADNSHKILEYLATGKVVVSNFLSVYKGKGMLEMPDGFSNESLPKIFADTIADRIQKNRKEEQLKRINYALEHSYSKQLDRIETILSNL
jgi:hypothetical protein